MSSFIKTLKEFFQGYEYENLESYLGQASNHADLERRIREWETKNAEANFRLP